MIRIRSDPTTFFFKLVRSMQGICQHFADYFSVADRNIFNSDPETKRKGHIAGYRRSRSSRITNNRISLALTVIQYVSCTVSGQEKYSDISVQWTVRKNQGRIWHWSKIIWPLAKKYRKNLRWMKKLQFRIRSQEKVPDPRKSSGSESRKKFQIQSQLF